MERPKSLEDFRFVGDKRTQIVYDLDVCELEDTISTIVAAESYATFGPDSLPEARNRGYNLCPTCNSSD